MKVKEIKILQDEKVEIVSKSSFAELNEMSQYSCTDVITCLEWNMNQARKELKQTLELLEKRKGETLK